MPYSCNYPFYECLWHGQILSGLELVKLQTPEEHHGINLQILGQKTSKTTCLQMLGSRPLVYLALFSGRRQLGAFRLGIRRESDARWAVLRDTWGSCFVVFRGSETVLDWTENSGLLEMVSLQVLENLWLFQFQLGTISPLSSQSGWPAFELWLLGHFWGNRMTLNC